MSTSFIETVQNTLAQQGQALLQLAERLNPTQYTTALHLILNCRGHVISSGMGKSGHVGRKISATMASTGTPSFFIHPAEAFHGDLGMITPSDLLILISTSGESDEILKLIPSLKSFGNKIIAITNNGLSTLAKHADAVLELQMTSECCPNNLVPTTSTTLTMAIGDALSMALMQKRRFRPDDFARYHPGGSLGRRLLTRVGDVMNLQVPSVEIDSDFQSVIQEMTSGRQGMVMVTKDAQLAGIITDGDLRRYMEKTPDFQSTAAREMMVLHPLTIPASTMLVDAEALMHQRRISSILVTEEDEQTVIGMVRIFD